MFYLRSYMYMEYVIIDNDIYTDILMYIHVHVMFMLYDIDLINIMKDNLYM